MEGGANMRQRIDTRGLKFKLWSYFILFAAVIMVVLWLLQIVFLKNYYQIMKTNEIKKIGDTIIEEYGKSDFADTIYKFSYNNGIFVQIVDQDGDLEMSPNMYGNMKPPHTDRGALMHLIDKLSQSDDGKVFYITTDQRVKGQVLVYGAVLPSSSSEHLYLYINSQVDPIDSTTTVLQNQLVIVMGISLLLSLAISLLIASKLSRPITKITQTAAELAKGNYNVKFEPGNYTEINQLPYPTVFLKGRAYL